VVRTAGVSFASTILGRTSRNGTRFKWKWSARVLAGSKSEQEGEKTQTFHGSMLAHSITSSARDGFSGVDRINEACWNLPLAISLREHKRASDNARKRGVGSPTAIDRGDRLSP
jgi:hypothetical protein